MDTHRIVIVRHGETPWSRSGQHTGRTDVSLDEAGREEATHLRSYFEGFSPAKVLTSPLSRAKETCRLAGFADLAAEDHDLVEWDYGDYEGQTTEEIRRSRSGWTIWADGVPGGESAADVGRRADRVLERARTAGGDTLCFAHGHLLRVLAARWIGLPPIGGRLLALGPGSVSLLGWEHETPVVLRWNHSPGPGERFLWG